MQITSKHLDGAWGTVKNHSCSLLLLERRTVDIKFFLLRDPNKLQIFCTCKVATVKILLFMLKVVQIPCQLWWQYRQQCLMFQGQCVPLIWFSILVGCHILWRYLLIFCQRSIVEEQTCHMNEVGPRRPLISHKPAFLTIKDVSSVIVEFILI